MTVIDYHNRRIPEYYDTMYMDGYEPWEILEAVHKSMRRMLAEREAEKIKKAESLGVQIISESDFRSIVGEVSATDPKQEELEPSLF